MTRIRFYITPRPLFPGSYYLHRGDCPLGGVEEKQTDVGFFSSPGDAMDSCRNIDIDVKECLFCSGNRDHRPVPGKILVKELIFSCIVQESPESALVCAIN